jgi:hypothetical protein
MTNGACLAVPYYQSHSDPPGPEAYTSAIAAVKALWEKGINAHLLNTSADMDRLREQGRRMGIPIVVGVQGSSKACYNTLRLNVVAPGHPQVLGLTELLTSVKQWLVGTDVGALGRSADISYDSSAHVAVQWSKKHPQCSPLLWSMWKSYQTRKSPRRRFCGAQLDAWAVLSRNSDRRKHAKEAALNDATALLKRLPLASKHVEVRRTGVGQVSSHADDTVLGQVITTGIQLIKLRELSFISPVDDAALGKFRESLKDMSGQELLGSLLDHVRQLPPSTTVLLHSTFNTGEAVLWPAASVPPSS